MEIEYIVAIAAGALFFILCVASWICYAKRRKHDELQRRLLEQMYSDKNLIKMVYDYFGYDEETKKILLARTERRQQMSFSDIYPSAVPANENPSASVDASGLEEITGNYKPE